MMHFPLSECLLKYAPNLTRLMILSSKLTRIDEWDLKGFDKLKMLDLDYNNIEELPSDLFTHTPNLEHISIAENNIKAIGEGILEPLRNLKTFDLSNNPSINVYYNTLLLTNSIDAYVTLAGLKEAIKRCKSVWEIVNEQKRKIEAQERGMDEVKKLCVDQTAKIAELQKELQEVKQARAFSKFDFTIKVDGKEFKVQKKVLTDNSPLLAQMIRDNEDADTLELNDISEETFEEILNFMVTKQPPKPAANFCQIYAASGRLRMKELVDLCAEMLMEKVTHENALKILNMCEKIPNVELRKKALDELKKSYER